MQQLLPGIFLDLHLSIPNHNFMLNCYYYTWNKQNVILINVQTLPPRKTAISQLYVALQEWYHFLLLVSEIGIHELALTSSILIFLLLLLSLCPKYVQISLKIYPHHCIIATISLMFPLYLVFLKVYFTFSFHSCWLVNLTVICLLSLRVLLITHVEKQRTFHLTWTLAGSWTVVSYFSTKLLFLAFRTVLSLGFPP